MTAASRWNQKDGDHDRRKKNRVVGLMNQMSDWKSTEPSGDRISVAHLSSVRGCFALQWMGDQVKINQQFGDLPRCGTGQGSAIMC